jgi:hypothetical protein
MCFIHRHYVLPDTKRLHGWASFPRGWKHFGMKTFWTEIARQVWVCKKFVDHLPARTPYTPRILNNFLSHTRTVNLSYCRTRLRNPPADQTRPARHSFLQYILYWSTVLRRSTLNSRTSFSFKGKLILSFSTEFVFCLHDSHLEISKLKLAQL